MAGVVLSIPDQLELPCVHFGASQLRRLRIKRPSTSNTPTLVGPRTGKSHRISQEVENGLGAERDPTRPVTMGDTSVAVHPSASAPMRPQSSPFG